MAVIQGLFAGLARSAGKIINTAFGWAAVMLFGKVPKDRQIYLSLIGFGSVIWLIVLVGIAFPSFAAWLLTFARLPRWVNHNWIRIAMLVAAVLLPLLVGVFASKAAPEHTKDKVTLGTLIRGYPYTLGMAIALVMLTVFAPVMKLRSLARKWQTEHVPVLIEPQDYTEVVGGIQDALRRGGRETAPKPATWMLRLPTRILGLLAGSSIKGMVADQLTTLVSPDFEAIIHPGDLAVSGKEKEVAHVRAIIAEHLAFSKAHMTWDKEAEDLEDRMAAIWRGLHDANGAFLVAEALGKLHVIAEDIRKLDVPYEEWEVLYRSQLQVEEAVLRAAAGYSDRPQLQKPKGEPVAKAPKPAMLQAPAAEHYVPPAIPGMAALTAAAAAAWLGFRRGRGRRR